ncbi:MAG: K+/H+ antiporter subunit F [Longimicrobiales bacterium]|nr:K+/H+ antiporter subunit F [Longimicrobiales bacterium]
MIEIATLFGMACIGVAMTLNVYRLVVGPDAIDRVVALDTLYVNTITILVLVGIQLDTEVFFEAALLIAMMGFVGTVTLAKYLRRGSIIE